MALKPSRSGPLGASGSPFVVPSEIAKSHEGPLGAPAKGAKVLAGKTSKSSLGAQEIPHWEIVKIPKENLPLGKGAARSSPENPQWTPKGSTRDPVKNSLKDPSKDPQRTAKGTESKGSFKGSFKNLPKGPTKDAQRIHKGSFKGSFKGPPKDPQRILSRIL